MPLILTLALILGSTHVGEVARAPDVICPLATLVVHKASTTRYSYGVSYTAPAGAHSPRYTWRVSAGKIIGNRKSHEIIVDTARAKTETVTVTVIIRWKNVNKHCDPTTLTDTIRLRD